MGAAVLLGALCDKGAMDILESQPLAPLPAWSLLKLLCDKGAMEILESQPLAPLSAWSLLKLLVIWDIPSPWPDMGD